MRRFGQLRAGRLARARWPIALAVAACLVLPGRALAGYGVEPNGQTIQVQTDSLGTISTPPSIDLLVYLDDLDSSPTIWVSETPTWDADGTPVGADDGTCSSSGLVAWSEPNKYVCSISTILLKPGTTYYWWLSFYRHDDASALGSFNVSGPLSFTLQLAPATTPATPPASTPTAPARTVTNKSAATLPASPRFDDRSVKDTVLTQAIYRTMKAVGVPPRTLVVACWTEVDFNAVIGGGNDDPDVETLGVWFPAQPHWLHLSGTTCTRIQRLIDTKAATGQGAAGLATALHEAAHAYGVKNEAEANCLAVQLVPVAATYLGLSASRADYLRKLGLTYVRDHAPAGYWNSVKCRDGGVWDLAPERVNLR